MERRKPITEAALAKAEFKDDTMVRAVVVAREYHLVGLLMSASHYVEGYVKNESNHPQARDGARTLLANINTALGRV